MPGQKPGGRISTQLFISSLYQVKKQKDAKRTDKIRKDIKISSAEEPLNYAILRQYSTRYKNFPEPLITRRS